MWLFQLKAFFLCHLFLLPEINPTLVFLWHEINFLHWEACMTIRWIFINKDNSISVNYCNLCITTTWAVKDKSAVISDSFPVFFFFVLKKVSFLNEVGGGWVGGVIVFICFHVNLFLLAYSEPLKMSIICGNMRYLAARNKECLQNYYKRWQT